MKISDNCNTKKRYICNGCGVPAYTKNSYETSKFY